MVNLWSKSTCLITKPWAAVPSSKSVRWLPSFFSPSLATKVAMTVLLLFLYFHDSDFQVRSLVISHITVLEHFTDKERPSKKTQRWSFVTSPSDVSIQLGRVWDPPAKDFEAIPAESTLALPYRGCCCIMIIIQNCNRGDIGQIWAEAGAQVLL